MRVSIRSTCMLATQWGIYPDQGRGFSQVTDKPSVVVESQQVFLHTIHAYLSLVYDMPL